MDVLLVEDDIEMRQLLHAVFVQRGYAVIAVADGEKAWEQFQCMEFSMVVIDWILPGMDGLELCRKIRKTSKGSNCLLLMITMRAEPDSLGQVLAAGFDDYITKPVDINLLNIRLYIAEQRVTQLLEQAANDNKIAAIQSNLEATLAAIPDLVFEMGLNGHIFNAHAAHHEKLFMPIKKFIGKSVSDVLPPDAVNVVLLALQEAADTGYSYGQQIEINVLNGVRYFEFSIARKNAVLNISLHYIAICHDITEHKIAEQRLTEAMSLVESANQVKSEFLSCMSHELRTPLNAILGFAQLLEAQNESFSADEKEFINEIMKGGYLLLSMINQILNLSQIDVDDFDEL